MERQGDEHKEALFQQQKARFELENKSLEATLAALAAETEKLKQNLLELKNDIDAKE